MFWKGNIQVLLLVLIFWRYWKSV